MAELVLGNGVGVVDLVAENDKGRVRKLFHGEKGIELGFRLGKTLVILRIDEENYAADFGNCVSLVLESVQTKGSLVNIQ